MKIGDDEISKEFREKFDRNLTEFQSIVTKTLESYSGSPKQYADKMQQSFNEVDYFTLADAMILHVEMKDAAISQV